MGAVAGGQKEFPRLASGKSQVGERYSVAALVPATIS
jgi:hypothetical protein